VRSRQLTGWWERLSVSKPQILLYLITWSLSGEQCKSRSSSLCSLLQSPVTSCYLLLPCFHQHPAVEHSLRQYLNTWPSFTPVQDKQYYGSVCLNIYILRQHTARLNGSRHCHRSVWSYFFLIAILTCYKMLGLCHIFKGLITYLLLRSWHTHVRRLSARTVEPSAACWQTERLYVCRANNGDRTGESLSDFDQRRRSE
jgi:hypothetical protein